MIVDGVNLRCSEKLKPGMHHRVRAAAGWRFFAARVKREVVDRYALPLLGDGLLCFYRDDLLQDKAVREDYEKAHAAQLPAAGRLKVELLHPLAT